MSDQLDLDLQFWVQVRCVWTWTRTFGVRSGPDPGPQGPGPDFGQSSLESAEAGGFGRCFYVGNFREAYQSEYTPLSPYKIWLLRSLGQE